MNDESASSLAAPHRPGPGPVGKTISSGRTGARLRLRKLAAEGRL